MSIQRPSVNWTGLDGLEPGPGSIHDRIKTVLSTINYAPLEEAALRARRHADENLQENISCSISSSSFAYGFNNVVLEVAFSDGVYWVTRVQHSLEDGQDKSEDMASEIATMREVKARTNVPVPQVFAYDDSSLNKVGYPYVLMEYIPGRTLGGTIASQVPTRHLPKVARQLAEVLHELYGLTFSTLGQIWGGEKEDDPVRIVSVGRPSHLPVATSLEWFFIQREAENRAALKDHPDDADWRTACWILKTAISYIVVEQGLHGPFPLCHLDFHYGNLLFDEDYNLVGVIDWTQAQTVPMERFVVSPEFVTFPAGSAELNQKILDLRLLVREHFEELERIDGTRDGRPPMPLSQLFGTKRAEITHKCTYSFPHRALWDGRIVARHIFGDVVSWEQLVGVYGKLQLD